MSVKDLAFETLRVTVDDMVLTVTLDDTGIPLNLFTWQRWKNSESSCRGCATRPRYGPSC